VSFTVAVKCQDGIVLATDSRRVMKIGEQYTSYDGEEKLWNFSAPHAYVGVVMYGFASLGTSMASWRQMFENTLPEHRVSIEDFASRLDTFLRLQQHRMIATVGGVDEDGATHLYLVDTEAAGPIEQHRDSVGLTYGGMREFADRLLLGYDARLSEVLVDVEGLDSLRMQITQDTFTTAEAVRFAGFLVEMTLLAQTFIAGLRGAGGPVHLATITREGLRWVQRPEAPEAQVEWHEIRDASPAVTSAPADGIAAASFGL
jgi:hypothetical protein